MDMGHLLKIDPASTGATARRLSRGKSPLKGRGAGGGAGAVELGLTLLLISLRRSSKAAGLWYRNRVRKRNDVNWSEEIRNHEWIWSKVARLRSSRDTAEITCGTKA
ncbi:hypothetical protein T4E_1651 [Trichinella pseudospiralis]|uniref:Uncharacterized protein n=1 Tax=Trichinella pseudospiralis TaxID=6337 RepID=A0A0V0Y603_TRIPS|nr:hypothetical protein T4E_1651 [Trichinella pseudospiralis]